ncbi:MAG: helicase-exonuclease AddAB subunit AddA [Oscillospiraceae bacterium]|jgi:ATP-dependent helicase/nuclease subunit A|nr:helicase-exonuclease AddAB subunit AddA [Oscillospiraceae bacterium]
MDWTKEQRDAIEARGGSLLVSAAAGSGKTAVLVERVLRRLTDPADPCDADQLLIVTFTRAAAAQMRERIRQALGEQLRADPGNTRLLRQQQLLPLARISTIDSFCAQLVREHFSALDLPPELRLLDESESALWQAEAAAETLEAAYRADSAVFGQLALLTEQGGDDARLAEAMRKACDMAMASPDPEDWFRRAAAPYQTPQPLPESPWGRRLLEDAAERLAYLARLSERLAEDLTPDEVIAAAYGPALAADARLYRSLADLARTGNWDALRTALQKPAYTRLGAKPRGYESEWEARGKAGRAWMKDEAKALREWFCVSAAEHEEDLRALRPVAEEFLRLAADFRERYAAKKRQKRAADFGDLLHWALRLLREPDGAPTLLAQALSAQFREILVDEYQDINEAQGQLFAALSRREENFFLVGDVKQSIYRFRQASPELFLEKRRGWAKYNAADYPACLTLGRNFRSRPGVTETVNFFFRQLMSERAAEMDYTAEDELVCGAAYPDRTGADAELHVLATGPLNADGRAQREADYIADYIAAAVARGDTILDHGEPRAVRPRDFCVLLRSDKKSGMIFAQALRARGVEAHTARTESLFRSREIAFLLSLLRVIDNPLLDVPLLAVMLSPVFGFSPADLARLRAARRTTPALYHCVLAAAQDADAACRAFLETLDHFRRAAAVMAPGDLIRFLLEETGYLAVAGAMPHPAVRRANLHRLEDYAFSFDATGDGNLSAFLRYMNQIEQRENLLAVSGISESADVVRIMSIHKSKGLEFPVCVLAQCGREFVTKDTVQPLLLHTRGGLGLQRPDPGNRRRLTTVPSHALRREMLDSLKSEELRLLYVAMTRAKERLVLLTSDADPAALLRGLAGRMTFRDPVMEPQAVRRGNCFADWILSAALRHPDAHPLREAAGLPTDETRVLPCPVPLACRIVPATPAETEASAAPDLSALPPPDEALLAEMQARLRYRYPYAALTGIAAKRAVSELTEREQRDLFAFRTRPAFLGAEGLTAAQRGTAMHSFLQYADYAAAARDPAAEGTRLAELGFLTRREADALDAAKLARFFAGDLARRLLASPRLLRERKFTIRLPAAEFAEDGIAALLEDEEVVIQGIVDCAFVQDGALVIVDYKTDRVRTLEELAARYGAQLRMYRRAMERCTGLPVAELLIYSFHLEEWTRVG